MKLHNTLVEKLLTIYEVSSGWPEQRKLREALKNLEVTIYTQKTGTEVLVASDDLKKATQNLKEGK